MTGYCETDKIVYKAFISKITDFIGKLDKDLTYADISPENLKMEALKEFYGIEVTQIDEVDYNKYYLMGTFDTVFCFEVLEHVQNPLFFMQQIRSISQRVFLSTPFNYRWMWSRYHFVEHPPEHWNKWVFRPAGFEVVRYKKLTAPYNLHNFGIRPILRKLLNTTYIYELR